MKIAVFGGTFDPIHDAHLKIAQTALLELNLDKVLFVPAATSPHKTSKKITQAKHRLKMVELAIRGQKNFEACDIEIYRGGVSYTYQTLESLSQKYYLTRDELYLIIGGDNLVDFSSWKNIEQIFKLCTICVAKRQSADDEKSDYNSQVHYLDFPQMNVSSSEIRGMLQRGEDVSTFLPKQVIEYITSNHLY